MRFTFKIGSLAFMTAMLLLAALHWQVGIARADSPLTSTAFHEAYANVAKVNEARKSGLTKSVAAFLASEKTALAEKAAAIHAIYAGAGAWEERDLASQYAKLAYGKALSSLAAKTLRPDEVFVVGYLKAMDRYLAPDTAWLAAAKDAMPGSMTAALVYALAQSQAQPDSALYGWCAIERVLNDASLKKDMRQDAIDRIKNYMMLYKNGECKDELALLLEQSVALTIEGPAVLIYGKPGTVDSEDAAAKPHVQDGVTLVPLRFVAGAFGAKVDYDAKKREVAVAYAGERLIFVEGEGGERPLRVLNGRTFVPLRTIAEALGKQVYYDQGLIILSNGISLNPQDGHDRALAEQVRKRLAELNTA
ncbi:copper amine oxidase N-terminal domain-containing protein [Paenibacillus methanolicus]|uniref:Copper amine oxidase-like protein n=1 Tax=Paenibacillus methanolicus TaxID=582686 RepID=A0A5S5BZN9_9BACL|nr:copper amine oxidase N-terminal domain-containing protein [Paenibacillus methanolicus]TYP71828.1 copper amine oxidase-like protein [Paenibacillus methanolicus]